MSVFLSVSVCLSPSHSQANNLLKNRLDSLWLCLIIFHQCKQMFLDASTHPYESVRLSVHPSVHPSIHLSVCLSVHWSIRSERFLVKAVSVWRLHFWQTTWKLAYRCILTSSIDYQGAAHQEINGLLQKCCKLWPNLLRMAITPIGVIHLTWNLSWMIKGTTRNSL